MTLSEELQWRGFANQSTFESYDEINNPRTFYLGVDPSSDSMTIGNLAAVMLVKHLIKAGHKAIVLVGGATGMIGDPKEDEERQIKSLEEIALNKAAIASQYKTLLEGNKFEMVDNYDWFKNMNYLTFLRDIGKNFSMTMLLDRDFVQTRVGEGGSGLSYAEFSYTLIQGYDYLHLYREMGATLQIGGSDQWGNMLSGASLIRKLEEGEAHVWTIPLVVNKTTGKKFGKSEDGAVWLDEKKTSPYKFYQFWINADDEGVEDYLKIYTELDKDSIEFLMKEHHEQPSARAAQRRLALEVTGLVHGKERAESVRRVSDALFGSSEYSDLQPEDMTVLQSELPTVDASLGKDLVELLTEAGLSSSKGEARRFLHDGAVYINGLQFSSEKHSIEHDDVMHGFVVLRRGKNAVALVKINEN